MKKWKIKEATFNSLKELNEYIDIIHYGEFKIYYSTPLMSL